MTPPTTPHADAHRLGRGLRQRHQEPAGDGHRGRQCGHRAQRDGSHRDGGILCGIELHGGAGHRALGHVIVTISGHDGTDLSLDKTTLTFTVDNWATAQTVTVKAGQDDDGANDTGTLTHSASGGDYASISVGLTVTVTDDDEAGVTIEPT